MGCDIHLAVQRKEAGRWVRVERVIANKYHDPEDPNSHAAERERIYHERNYTVFAVLADVRNGTGFAGIETHKPITPISPPRGLPKDFVEECAGEGPYSLYHEGSWMGEHSHTWLTLAEVEAYPWGQDIERVGWVSAPVRAAQLSSRRRAPSEWCGMITGRGITHVPLEVMDRDIACGKVDAHQYALVHWSESLRWNSCESFYGLLPALRALADSSEDVRLVMGFDS